MRKVAITTNSAQFEIRRNKLMDEYLREVHPLWLECQRQMEQAGSHTRSDHLISEFRGKIRPRLEELFTEIARLKLAFREDMNNFLKGGEQ